jgi:hypothetical protein
VEKERLGPTVFVEAEQAASCSADAGGIAAAAVRASAALVELPAFAAVFAVVAAESSVAVALQNYWRVPVGSDMAIADFEGVLALVVARTLGSGGC